MDDEYLSSRACTLVLNFCLAPDPKLHSSIHKAQELVGYV